MYAVCTIQQIHQLLIVKCVECMYTDCSGWLCGFAAHLHMASASYPHAEHTFIWHPLGILKQSTPSYGIR